MEFDINNITYQEFIQNIINTRGQWNIPEGERFDRHHIIPRCLDGSGDKIDGSFKKKSHNLNCIWLYQSEHYIAHYLLAKENMNNYKLCIAWYRMNKTIDTGNIYIDSLEYEKLKNTAQSRPGELNGMFGKYHSEKSKKQMSQNHDSTWAKSEEGRQCRSEISKQSNWYTNGISETFSVICPDGWYKGRKPGTNVGGKNASAIRCYVYNLDKQLVDICECINYAGLKYGLADREAKDHTGWNRGPYKGYYFIKESEVLCNEKVLCSI